ncbi:PilN domain-containing protein [Pseudomarimonas salicorniae]|uniref:PilN domain-containing protein n=1 Tax=Pseudomarimonas salicorniae TaxID=2933270 RepID=A0ABT0GKL2_9GAMM|nr:PilN domain-containing protein [Lysobacter sp. CAU 1642]MCK7594555.1 PilN domain-containing protein [Lysobacter sp. CAU 1642]
MTRINLLPWRQERRAQRQKEYLTILGLSGFAAVALAFGVIQYYDALIENQNDRNNYLKAEITQLDIKIKEIEELEKKRAHLLNRKQVIEQLQADRSQMVHLFDQLVRTIPEGIRLNSIKQTGTTLTLDGLSQSNARVASYMRSLEGSGWMSSPEVSIIEAKEGEDKLMPYQFTLKVQLTKPKPPKEGEVAAEEGVS